jgi:hypothetical protein
MNRASRRSADGRWPVVNGTHCFDVAVHQVSASNTPSGSTSAALLVSTPHVLEALELTVLTGWAEAVAEALAHAPERAAAVLDEARPGAPWRTTLALPEPSPRLSEAIESLDRLVRAATPSYGPPTFDALLEVANVESAGESTLDGLVRRVLLSMLEERITRQPTRADASPSIRDSLNKDVPALGE